MMLEAVSPADDGTTSEFSGQSDKLTGVQKFTAVLTTVNDGCKPFKNVSFKYPEGNEEEHHHELGEPADRGESGSRFRRSEQLPTAVAPKALHLEHGRFERRLPDDTHQGFGLFLAVHFAGATFGTGISGVECLVPDGDSGSARECVGAVAPVALHRRFGLIGVSALSSGEAQWLRQHRWGLFGGPLPHQSFRHGVQRRFELPAIGLTQWGPQRAVDNPI